MQNNDPCGCNAVLIQSTESTSSSRDLKLAILKTITKESFEQLKKEINAGGSFFDVISAHGDYQSFDTHRTSEILNESYNLDLSEAESVLKSFVPGKAIEAWQACKEKCSNDVNGFHCWVKEFDDNSVTVVFYWNPPAGVKDAKVADSSLHGVEKPLGLNSVFPVGFVFEPEEKITRIFPREPNKSFKLAVNVDPGYTASLSIPEQISNKISDLKFIEKVYVLYSNKKGADFGYLAPEGNEESYLIKPGIAGIERVFWNATGNIEARPNFAKIEISIYDNDTLLLLIRGTKDSGTLGITVTIGYR